MKQRFATSNVTNIRDFTAYTFLLNIIIDYWRGSSIKYVRKIFRKTNISNPLIRKRTYHVPCFTRAISKFSKMLSGNLSIALPNMWLLVIIECTFSNHITKFCSAESLHFRGSLGFFAWFAFCLTWELRPSPDNDFIDFLEALVTWDFWHSYSLELTY